MLLKNMPLDPDRGVTDWKPGTFYRLNDDVLHDLQMFNCTQAS